MRMMVEFGNAYMGIGLLYVVALCCSCQKNEAEARSHILATNYNKHSVPNDLSIISIAPNNSSYLYSSYYSPWSDIKILLYRIEELIYMCLQTHTRDRLAVYPWPSLYCYSTLFSSF